MPTANKLPRSTPEAQGISSSAILSFIDAIEENVHYVHSFMLLRHGYVIAEGWRAPYRPSDIQELFSLSKSFTSTAIGLAIAEGLLTVNDAVVSCFPKEAPNPVGNHLAAMQIQHLLSLVTGHEDDTLEALFASEDGDWVRAFLAQPVEYPPGAPFVYNSGASYMLSAIVQRVTGMTTLDYLQTRLFDKMATGPGDWEQCPRGVNVGGWGLSLKTEDVACLGQLYLQQGQWNGEQLLPKTWIESATKRQVTSISRTGDPDWQEGYGYHFWRSRHNGYHASGAFGQFCLVLPDQDAVFVTTSGLRGDQSVLDQVWTHLLSAMETDSLPADPDTYAQVTDRLASLSLPKPQGMGSSPLTQKVSRRCYVFAHDDKSDGGHKPMPQSITWRFEETSTVLTIADSTGEHHIMFGLEDWCYSETTLHHTIARPIAGIGTWIDNNTFQGKFCFLETPFCPMITCRFEADRVFYDFELNINFGPTKRPQLVGQSRT